MHRFIVDIIGYQKIISVSSSWYHRQFRHVTSSLALNIHQLDQPHDVRLALAVDLVKRAIAFCKLVKLIDSIMFFPNYKQCLVNCSAICWRGLWLQSVIFVWKHMAVVCLPDCLMGLNIGHLPDWHGQRVTCWSYPGHRRVICILGLPGFQQTCTIRLDVLPREDTWETRNDAMWLAHMMLGLVVTQVLLAWVVAKYNILVFLDQETKKWQCPRLWYCPHGSVS